MTRTFLLPLFWLLVMTVLFLLPGSALPEAGLLSSIGFDKWVHFGLFALLLWLWGYALLRRDWRTGLLLTALFTAYGLGVEVVQDTLIANRSFDLGDLVADCAGCFGGWTAWRVWGKKDKPL